MILNEQLRTRLVIDFMREVLGMRPLYAAPEKTYLRRFFSGLADGNRHTPKQGSGT